VGWSQEILPKLTYVDGIFKNKAPLQSPMLIVAAKPEDRATVLKSVETLQKNYHALNTCFEG
jgi:hypothetical protein